MAKISKILSTDEKWSGPYPSRAGDFCGNSRLNDLEISAEGLPIAFVPSIWENDESEEPSRITNLRIGKPSKIDSKTSEEMERDGEVGLYLIEDSPHYTKGEVEIDTDVLQEEVVTGQRLPRIPFRPGVPMDERGQKIVEKY